MSAAPAQDLPTGWRAMQTARGTWYYVDDNTRTTHWEPPKYLRRRSYQIQRTSVVENSTLQSLQDMFPSWDSEAILDVLTVSEYDINTAVTRLTEWTEHPAQSPVLSPDLDLLNVGGLSMANLSTTLPKQIQKRESYDQVMAARLERSCPSPRSLVMILMAVNKMRARSQAADAHVNEHAKRHRWGHGTSIAKRPLLNLFKNRGKDRSPKKSGSSSPTKSPPESPVSPSESPTKHPTGIHEEDHTGLSREDAIVLGMKLLDERLQFLKLRTIKSKDDGNCQFRSISRELYGTEDYHFAVRKAVVAHMKKSSSIFQPYVGDTRDFDSYLESMDQNKTWGDELTLRASADCFGVDIHVITTEKDNYLLTYEPDIATRCGRHLFLSYVSPIHYNTIQPL